MEVPFIDLGAQYRSIKSAIDEAVAGVFRESQFIRGKAVAEFETLFASVIQVKHVIGTANGTDSLLLALKAINIQPGDEVITPAWSWISSAETISLAGARVVFADVDERDYTISVEEVLRKITPATKAVIAVHLYGHPARVDALSHLCAQRSIRLIEDCAQAHGSALHGIPVGGFGTLASFSFYPTKNLGAYGDAGCVATNDEALAEFTRRIANHGALRKDDHLMEGFNSRMDTIQAAVLNVKLPHLKTWVEKRRFNASLYRERLAEIHQILLPSVAAHASHSYHIYAIQAHDRDGLKAHLENKGIQTVIHYPRALSSLPFYRNADKSSFPVSEKLEKTILSLPNYPELTQSQIGYVCHSISEYYR
jgi:dTDP-4-amino-4,6-dideoxygalactose transaminase